MTSEMQAGQTAPVSRLPEPQSPRWQLLRAGLQNIWEYDDQRFVFHHGRLLLLGANASGKTKAVEVLLPFLLDADLSPQRLDPFGSTSRPMRWNLINENNPEVSVSVGYAWLEFGRDNDGDSQHLTIGAGLRARRSSSGVDSWYFVTSQRVDEGLQLFDGGRRPLERPRLEEAIGEAGSVFERKTEYRHAVNQQLFQMPHEQYGALIEALLQLRRPQLSKQLEPRELSLILTRSLPPLERQVIGSLAEGFEQLDRHSADRDEYKRSLETVQGFLAVYRRYATVVAKGKAQEVTKAESAYQRARAELREKREEHDAAKTMQTELTEKIAELEKEEETLSERIQTLRSSDAYRAVQQLDHAENLAREHAKQAENAKRRLAGETKQVEGQERDFNSADSDVSEQTMKIDGARTTAGTRAEEAALENDHRSIEAQLESEDLDAASGTLSSVFRQRDMAITTLSRYVEQVIQAEQVSERAEERLRDADERVRNAEAALSEAEHEETAARERYATDVSAWLDSLEVLMFPAEARATLLDLPAEEMRSLAEREAGNTQVNLDEKAAEVGTALKELQRRIGETKAERDDLASATHLPPVAPAWRPPRPEDRPGAPFYLLCDFKIEDSPLQANIEAALEAAGLLDAWITPEGVVLDRDTFDVVLYPDPQAGASLADVLEPTEAGGVARRVIGQVLKTIGLVTDDGSLTEPNCWVAGDGRWRVGPLQGTWRKDVPTYIGASARERERKRRLAELEAHLREFDDHRTELQGKLDSVHDRRARLQEELECFPNLISVLNAQAQVKAANLQLSDGRVAQNIAAEAQQKTQAALGDAVAARDVAATKAGLRAWVNTLGELRDRTLRYREAAHELLREARELAARKTLLNERRRALDQAARRVDIAHAEVENSSRRVRKSDAHAAALREAAGSTREELLAALRAAQERYTSVRDELDNNRKEKSASDQLVGEISGAVTAAHNEVDAADRERTSAEARFKKFARSSFLPIAGIEIEGTPEPWTYTDTLRFARGADAATDGVDCSTEARERAENRVVERHQELMRSLPPEVRLHPQRVEGLLEYESTFNARSIGLLQLASDLKAEVTSRDRLLGDEERELFESFLSGETHQHLRGRLRDARELVERMNDQLKAHPAASGMQLRLRWDVTKDAPTGTREAIADLHGWKTMPKDPVHISLEKLEAALRASSVNAGIVEVVEGLGGPLTDCRASKDAARQAREQLWTQAASHHLVVRRPELARWLDDIRAGGFLTRSARRVNVDEAVLLDLALRVVGRLPARGTLLAVLAAEVSGDAHALDPGRPLASLVLRAAVHLAGWSKVPSFAAARRRLWAEVGVLCDPLSAHVLVFGLRPEGNDRLARNLREWADSGEPRRITLRELAGSTLTIAPEANLFVCENPAVVAAAADQLGDRSAALLCVEGIPSTAALEMLSRFRDGGTKIRFHADFDWGGVRIGNLLTGQFGAVPWRFTASDYNDAVSTTSEAVPLKDASVIAIWDPNLEHAMLSAGRAVFEEQVLPSLLDDLSSIGLSDGPATEPQTSPRNRANQPVT